MVVMLNVVMLNVVMLNVVMPNVIMLNVVLLNAVMLNVVVLNARGPFIYLSPITFPFKTVVSTFFDKMPYERKSSKVVKT